MLRRREEEIAIRTRAEAEAAADRAALHVSANEAILADRLSEAATVQDPARREWYRNWMIRQRQEIARAKAMLADRRVALAAATNRVNLAHRDVRVLERLRERKFAAWQLAERRAEQKELDWLGTVRHTIAARQQEEDR